LSRDDYRNPDLNILTVQQYLDFYPDENCVGEPYEDFPMPLRRSRAVSEAPAVPRGVPSSAPRDGTGAH
jgi:hypothetical protein